MGKQKKVPRSRVAPSPLRLPAPASPPQQPSPLHASLLAAKQQLQMVNIEEKLCGLQTVATALESAEHLDLIKAESFARIIAPLMLDDNAFVRNSSAGTLRNFSILDLEASDYLIEQGVLTLLVAFFQKYAVNWSPKTIKSAHLDDDADTFLHAVHLLWNLCESTETAIKHLNHANILPILTRCLDREVFGDEIVIAVLHCLTVVTEDNPNAIEEIMPSCHDHLYRYINMEGGTPNDLLLKTLSAGLILNLQGKDITSVSETVLKIVEILATTLSFDLRNAIHQISSALPIKDMSEHSSESSNHSEPADTSNILKYVFDALQTAIEIVTNMCSLEEDGGTDGEASDADSDMEIDDIEQSNGINGCVNNALPSEISNLIISNGFVDKIWVKSLDVAENVRQILDESDEGKTILQKLSTVRSRSLLCMNNFIENLPIDALGGYAGIYKYWIEMGKIVFQTDVNNNEAIVESATAAMRAMIDKIKVNLKSNNGIQLIKEVFNDLTLDDIQVMLTGINQCNHAEIRVNLIRMLGNLSLILMAKTSYVNIEKVIPEFLLELATKESECWVLSEVLDTLMDVFAEDDTDLLAKQIKLINILTSISPVIRNKARQQRKTLGDHYAVVNTVNINLPRFIKYKKQRIDMLNS